MFRLKFTEILGNSQNLTGEFIGNPINEFV